MIGQFQIWLQNAKSNFVSFWADKVNRTTVLTFDGTTPANSLVDVPLPKGTWWFEFRNTGGGEIIITFANGGTMEIRGQVGATSPLHDNVFFPGAPYVERDDIFKEIDITNISGGKLEIVCHRIIPRGT